MSEASGGLDALHHVYDTAMRLWGESVKQLAEWLDPSVAGLADIDYVAQPAAFAAPVLNSDQLIAVGPDRLMHVEYETSPDDELVQRMYDYRGRITRAFPGKRITQHVIVLGSGTVRGYDDLQANGFALDLQVIYLRDRDPADFLADPFLAPFAVLARGSREQRERSFSAALRTIRDSHHRKKNQLMQVADALAGIRLDRSTIDRIIKEDTVNIQPLVDFYRDTEVGLELQDIGRLQGQEAGERVGREKGEQVGREYGEKRGTELTRERVLLALLRVRFGDQPDAPNVAHRLAGWDNEVAAVEAVTAASDLASLLDIEAPA